MSELQKQFEIQVNLHLKEIQYLVNTEVISIEEGKTLTNGLQDIVNVVEMFQDFE